MIYNFLFAELVIEEINLRVITINDRPASNSDYYLVRYLQQGRI